MTTNSTSASGRRSKKLGCLLRVVMGTCLLLLLALSGGWVWLQSGPGKVWLANRLSASLDGAGGQTIQVTGLDGRVPFDMTVQEVSVHDGEGGWLWLTGLRLRWSPLELLLHRRLDIEEVSARTVRMDRRPAWVASPMAENAASESSFSVPPILVRTVTVDRVTLSEEVVGQTATYSVHGNGESGPGLREWAGEASVTERGQGRARLSGTVGFRPADGHIAVQATLLSDTNSATHQVLRAHPAGNLLAHIRGEGTADRFAGEMALDASLLGKVRADLETGWQPGIWANATGDVQVVAEQVQGFPAEATFTVQLQHSDGPWTIQSGLRGSSDPWEGAADLTLDPDERTLRGTFNLSLPRLAPWLEPAGVDLDGNVQLRADLAGFGGRHALTITGLANEVTSRYGTAHELRVHAHLPDLAGVEGTRALTFTGSADSVTFEHGAAEAFGMRAHLPDFRNPASLTATFVATNVQREAILAREAEVRLERRHADWALEVSARGAYHREYELAGAAQMTLASNRQSLLIEQLAVTYDEIPGHLSTPFLMAHESGRWNLAPARLAVGDASLSLEGHYDDASVGLTASLTNLSMRALPVAMAEGLPAAPVHARLTMTGHPASPVVSMEAWSSNVVPEDFRLEEWVRAGVSAGASITGGTLSIKAETTSFPAGDLDFEARMPLAFSLQPFALEWSPDPEVKVRLDADLDLASLNRLGLLKNQEVHGRLRAGLVYEGLLREAEADGSFTLEQGAYQHHRFGLILRDLTADVQVREGALVLDELAGTDGENGRLSATGRWELDPAARWPFAAELRTDSTTVLRQDHLSATASARLNVTGNVSEVSVQGDVAIDSGEFRIDLLPPAPPPVLEVTHVGRDAAPVVEPEDAAVERPPGPTVRGELELALAGPFFVRGAGIDSSWRGRLRLQSDGGPWRIRGVLQPRRGAYEFFGKRFTLVDSRVHFDGSTPPMPVLDVTAEHERQAILARLRISGRLDDPKLKLESDPDFPPDEILARVMFGTSASGLTPLQTAQLALAVASMAREAGGEQSSWDLMGRTRNLLQVDELGLREDPTDASQVELVAGRYVSDRLFLEFSQRVGSRESGLRAEYEINRHLSVETDAGAQMRPGIRLNIRLDY